VHLSTRLRPVAVVMLTWIALPVTATAWAGGEEFHIEPGSGVAGQKVAVSGSGWAVGGGDVEVYAPGVSADSGDPWVTGPVLDDGTFSQQGVIPPLPTGEAQFTACQQCVDSGDGTTVARSLFEVEEPEPDLQLDSYVGVPDKVVGITGSGWSPKLDVMLYLGSEQLDEEHLLKQVTPAGDGTIPAETTFRVPSREAGDYTFFACQSCDAGAEATTFELPFEILGADESSWDPTIQLDRQDAAVGESVIVTGKGWSDEAGEVSVYAGESAWQAGEDPLSTKAVVGGGFTTPITVPPTESASLTVFACQECGDEGLDATASLEITVAGHQPPPDLHLLPGSGEPGDKVQATGSDWRDGPVSLFIRPDGSPKRLALKQVTAVNGTFEVTLTVPDLNPGQAEILACQQCGDSKEITHAESFTILSPRLDRRTLSVDPPSTRPGRTVTLRGTGWPAESGAVTVYLEPHGSGDRAFVWVDRERLVDGSFAVDVEVPDRAEGGYDVIACQLCDDPSGPRPVTTSLTIGGGGVNWLLVAGIAAAALVVGVLAWLLVRIGRGPGSLLPPQQGEPPATPPRPPVVVAVPDHRLDVELYAVDGRPRPLDTLGFDVVVQPDPRQLTDQVEVYS